MKRGPLAEEIGRLMDKAQRSLDAAENLKKVHPDFAVSRAYYGAFYAIQALLLSKGHAFSSHSASLGAFHREFIKTGLFPRILGKSIDRLFKDRQVGDYEPRPLIDIDRASEDIDLALALLNTVSKHLRQEGFLPAQ